MAMKKVTIKVPSSDRRRKNFEQTGILFTAAVGNKLVRFVHQENGDVAHYATGGLVLRANSIKARQLSRYVANPYGDRVSDRVMAGIMIAEIDAERFFRVTEAHPILNTGERA